MQRQRFSHIQRTFFYRSLDFNELVLKFTIPQLHSTFKVDFSQLNVLAWNVSQEQVVLCLRVHVLRVAYIFQLVPPEPTFSTFHPNRNKSFGNSARGEQNVIVALCSGRVSSSRDRNLLSLQEAPAAVYCEASTSTFTSAE